MALRAASPLAPFWYEPKDESGEPCGTRFLLCGLKSLELADVNALAIHDGGNVKFPAAAIRLALRLGLRGWENLLDEFDRPIEFSKSSEANLDRLPFILMSELFGKITDASSLGSERAKN
jgi:hypothetical protein